MSAKKQRPPAGGRARLATPAPAGRRIAGVPMLGVAAIAAVLVVAVAIVGFVALGGGSRNTPATASVQHVTADRLAEMLKTKDFTLLNVKTPYYGEIDGTDLYIPYDQLAARRAELPADRSAKILVYCRTGVESSQAAQTLINLGYTNVWNLDGGMVAWEGTGRTLLHLNR